MSPKVTILRQYKMNNESYEHTVYKFIFPEVNQTKITSSLSSFLALHLPNEAVWDEHHIYDLYITVRDDLKEKPCGTFHHYLETNATIQQASVCIYQHLESLGTLNYVYVTTSLLLLNPFPRAAEESLEWFMNDVFGAPISDEEDDDD